MKYDMVKNNHRDCLNKGPWYNTSIFLKLHGIRFEDFITQAITDRYNLMCSLVAHDKMQPYYKDDEISIGDRSIPDNATPKSLESLGATINFVDIYLKFFLEKYDAICVAYINAMNYILKQIPLTIKKPLTPKQNSRNS